LCIVAWVRFRLESWNPEVGSLGIWSSHVVTCSPGFRLPLAMAMDMAWPWTWPWAYPWPRPCVGNSARTSETSARTSETSARTNESNERTHEVDVGHAHGPYVMGHWPSSLGPAPISALAGPWPVRFLGLGPGRGPMAHDGRHVLCLMTGPLASVAWPCLASPMREPMKPMQEPMKFRGS